MDTPRFHGIATYFDNPHLSRRRLLGILAAAAGGAALAPLAGGRPAAALQTAPAGANIPHTIPADASPRFRAVAERLLAAMAEYQVPGAALGILADGREEHATFGVASVETNQPVTAETRFQIGSLTKTYTGTAVMRLIDQGRLDLDATVRTYLPQFRVLDQDVAARVTVRHLLTHTADWWGDDEIDTGDDDDAIARYVAERLPTIPQLAPLGAFFSYNNTALTVLGRLIEVATGQPYRAAMQDLVLDPLGMADSTFARAVVERRPFAVGHGEGPRGTEPITPLYLPRWADPAGLLWSTTRDQLRYARFHLGDGTAPSGARLLAPYTLGLMRTPQVAFSGTPSVAMGMNWFVQDSPGLRLAYHAGDTLGQHTMLLFAPARGFAFVLLTNHQPGGAQLDLPAFNEATQRYLGLGLESARGPFGVLAPGVGTPTIAVPADQLAQYAGRYSTPTSAFVLRVENGGLLATTEYTYLPDQTLPSILPEPARDVPVPFAGADLGLLGAGLLPFVRKPNGEVGWIFSGLRLMPRTGPA